MAIGKTATIRSICLCEAELKGLTKISAMLGQKKILRGSRKMCCFFHSDSEPDTTDDNRMLQSQIYQESRGQDTCVCEEAREAGKTKGPRVDVESKDMRNYYMSCTFKLSKS